MFGVKDIVELRDIQMPLDIEMSASAEGLVDVIEPMNLPVPGDVKEEADVELARASRWSETGECLGIDGTPSLGG